MRMSLLAIAATGALAFGSTLAAAAPLVPLVADGAAPSVTLVAEGCGLGYSRGSYGRCRPNSFGFGAPGGRRFGYGGVYGDRRPYGDGYRRPYARPYGYRPYRYGY